MVRNMEEVHPDLYHDISKEELARKIDSINATITDSLTAEQAWPKFATIIGAINEGHTSIKWPDEFLNSLLQDRTFLFPVFIREFDGEALIVRYDVSIEKQLQTGDRVLSINGEGVANLMSRLTKFVGGLPSWKNLSVVQDLSSYLAVTRMQGPYKLIYSRNGKQDSVSLQALPRQMLFTNLTAVRGSNRTAIPSYEFSRIDNNIGYLNFRSMVNPQEFDYFIDSVFNAIKAGPVNALIVDLRRNGGGNSALGDRLLSHFTTKKYRMAAGMKWKISQQYKDHYNSLPVEMQYLRDNDLEKKYMKGKKGTFIEEKSELVTPKERANRYNGNVYFLIGPNTFSSANMLANAVKDFQLATLIGEPTGESPNDYGELITLKLPNTGITFFTSTKQYIRANGDANDRNPVLPDHFIKDDPTTSVDEVLEFAVKRSQGRN